MPVRQLPSVGRLLGSRLAAAGLGSLRALAACGEAHRIEMAAQKCVHTRQGLRQQQQPCMHPLHARAPCMHMHAPTLLQTLLLRCLCTQAVSMGL